MDATKAGSYKVTYTYEGVTATANITVKVIQESIDAKDLMIYVGDNWNAKDDFVSATDKNGNQLNFNEDMAS